MNENTLTRLARWLLAAATLLLAALLTGHCAAIYLAGASDSSALRPIYSPQIVAQHLGDMAWALWVWLGCLALALISGAHRSVPSRPAPPPLEERVYLAARRAEPTPAMERERRLRRGLNWGLGALILACACPMILYLTDSAHFPTGDLEGAMGGMLLALGPWLALILLGLMAAAQLRCRSLSRELQAAAQAPRASGPAPGPDRPLARRDNAGLWRGLLLLCAAALIAAGVLNGGLHDVLVKAVNICTECIGLG
ncbi:MAG TPA: hypothetical protein IAA74_07195 [Candidatus Excrementavichristensenella intestinipullorum]|nr:hypothetical protein [Candidatus Excrementavichristensenella intestinipullorum]